MSSSSMPISAEVGDDLPLHPKHPFIHLHPGPDYPVSFIGVAPDTRRPGDRGAGEAAGGGSTAVGGCLALAAVSITIYQRVDHNL